MKIWYLIHSPAGCPSGDTSVVSAWDSPKKAEAAIVALSADPDQHGNEDDATSADSPFNDEMCNTLETWIEEITVG